jgi:CDP-6-deoxy-D-xylo-4-hexulose-3-dehydrase
MTTRLGQLITVHGTQGDPNARYLVVSEPSETLIECVLTAPAATPDTVEVRCKSNLDDNETCPPSSVHVNLRRFLTFQSKDVRETSLHALEKDLDSLLREMVRNSVLRYYRGRHLPINTKAFTRGDRVPYAGRVFDEQELLTLSEAMMDFWLTSGRFTEQFERSFAEKLGVRFAALVNSGSSANLIALSTLTSTLLGADRLKPGDEVITVAAGFPTTISPIIQNNCVPVFVDVTVDDGTYNIDVTQLTEALSERTRAVMVAHTLGNPFNLGVVTEFCADNDLWLIEDNCDALGSRYQGQLTGTFGDIATSSFYPPHHMTMGEGGAVYSKTVKLKRIVESFRDWGRDCWCPAGKDNTCGKRFSHSLGDLPFGYDHKYIYRHLGYNLKAGDLQAAVGCAQLEKLDTFVRLRRRNWQTLREDLNDLNDVFILPDATPSSEPSWFGFALTLREGTRFDRNEIVEFLESKNIQTRMLFAGNVLRHPLFDDMRQSGVGYRVVGNLANSDRILERTFWLGVYPGLTTSMLEYVIESIRNFVQR